VPVRSLARRFRIGDVLPETGGKLLAHFEAPFGARFAGALSAPPVVPGAPSGAVLKPSRLLASRRPRMAASCAGLARAQKGEQAVQSKRKTWPFSNAPHREQYSRHERRTVEGVVADAEYLTEVS
jgi:hypothetical protein